MVVVTLLALLQIEFNSGLTAVFLGLELAVVVILLAAGVVHLNQPLSILSHPMATDGGALKGIATGAIVTVLATAMFSVNGNDAAALADRRRAGRAAIARDARRAPARHGRAPPRASESLPSPG